MDFTSLAGVMALFATKGGMLVGWVHYLAFDLFAGMWIARDADQKGFSRIVQFPLLVLTLLAGPVGLLAWLIVRERRARALARAKRSEEHTSELQPLMRISYAVFCLKTKNTT